MNEVCYDKYFINPAIENGITAYIQSKNENSYDRIHTFELNVIKALTIIYGEKSILLPYKIDNERAFECNLLMYDLHESDMKKFLTYMNEYNEFLNNITKGVKATGLINEIEKILIQMINKRSSRKEFNEEEIKLFDCIFNPIEGDLKQIKKLLSNDNGLIIKTWEINKYGLTNTQMKMMAVNPNLLAPDVYAKYGFDIRNICLLSEEEIININNKINNDYLIKENNKKGILKKRRQIILTCGNGFVDKILLLSIIATEIMIGVIIFSIMR